MGLTRKLMSASTLGAVKYTSKREAQTKAALAEAKLAKAQAKALKAESAPTQREETQDTREDKYAQHVQAYLDGQYPKWKLNTRELRLLAQARKEQGDDGGGRCG